MANDDPDGILKFILFKTFLLLSYEKETFLNSISVLAKLISIAFFLSLISGSIFKTENNDLRSIMPCEISL